MQVLEAFREIAAVMVIHGKRLIAVTDCWVVDTEKALLKNDSFGL